MSRMMLFRVGFCSVLVFCAISSGAVGRAGSSGDGERLRIRDDCDPATFNAALGAGACVGDGDTTLARFQAELAEERSVGSWRFNPDKEFTIDFGRTLTIESRAGETHTFTRVANFGGGFVAGLNAASGNPVPAPECAVVNVDGTLRPQPAGPANLFVRAGTTVAGPTAGGPLLPVGRSRFQCCIHPWMRTTARVR
jgi:hypothetical protein